MSERVLIRNDVRSTVKHGERKGEVLPYITAMSGKPAAVDPDNQLVMTTLSGYGEAVPIPEGMEVTEWPECCHQ